MQPFVNRTLVWITPTIDTGTGVSGRDNNCTSREGRGVGLAHPDFARLADSFGIASFKASDATQLEAALHKAFALNAPALVWVPHGDVPSPWDLIMMPKVRG